MAWGMRAFNQATGSVQIDERYANFALAAKAVVTTDHQGDGSVGAILTVTGDAPVIAIRSDTHFVTQHYVLRSGSTWYFFLQAWSDGGAAAAGIAITCFVYDKPGALIGPHGYGVAVRDAANELTFHSSRKYMRVEALITGANYRTALPSAGFAAGRTYAVAPAKFAGETSLESIADGTTGDYITSLFTHTLGFRWTGTALSTAEAVVFEIVNIGPLPATGYTYTSLDYAFMVLDVTHQ